MATSSDKISEGISDESQQLDTDQSAEARVLESSSDCVESTLLRSYQQISLASDDTASESCLHSGECDDGDGTQQQATKVLKQPIPRLPRLQPLHIMSNESGNNATRLEPERFGTLQKIELQLDLISNNITNVLDHLRDCTHQATQASVDCLCGLKQSVGLTCDDVDANIKSMYRLIAKCDEISESIKSVDIFANEVRCLKRDLDSFETVLKQHKTATNPQ